MIRPVVVTALAGAAVLFGTTTAAASPVRPDSVFYFSGTNCHPSQHALCLFRDAGYSGGGILLTRRNVITSLSRFHFNDAMSSWSNDTGVECGWFTDSGFGGASHLMENGYRIELPSDENDTASSVQCAG